MSIWLILKVATAFFIGAIPFAKVAMWGTGVDITKVGSGNPGFNNVLRVSTKPRAAVALIGDMGKGLLALLLLASGEPLQAQWAIGIAALAGHCWSPFLGWNGGKGVATTFGVLLFVAPWPTLVCLPLYPILRSIFRRLKQKQEGALASLIVMAIIAAWVGSVAYLMLAIVVVRHASNLREIFAKRA